MNTGSDAAEQVVRMSLNGVEIAAKITGTGAINIAKIIYAVMQDQTKTKGKTRLNNMLKSGKELKIFAVKDSDLKRFCIEAKKYGVLYCVLKDKDANDGLTEIMVRAEDAAKINRIFERFDLANTDIASVKNEIDKDKGKEKDDNESFLDSIFNEEKQGETTQKSQTARTEKLNQSEHISENKKDGKDFVFKRQSILQELNTIKESRQKNIKIPIQNKVKEKGR